MRSKESLLMLADLLAFLVLMLPLPPALHWMQHLTPVALLVAGVQVLVEGPRWQMVPAYALTGLLFLVWLLQLPMPAGELAAQRWAGWLAVGFGVLVLVISFALPMIFPVFHFPHPGGPYLIGTLTYHWIDADRSEVFTSDPTARRELMVQIWYPARGDPSSTHAPYVQDAGPLSAALARIFHFPAFIFSEFRYVTTHAIPSAPVAGDEPGYPVLMLLEGLGGFRQASTFQVEELVSHGFIVAAIDQPYAAAAVVVFPDGRRAVGLPIDRLKILMRPSLSPIEQAPTLYGRAFADGTIPYLAQDVIFTLDQLAALNQADPNGLLTGRLDLQRAGLFGVSLGGIVGSEACRLEPRLRAYLIMDAPMPAAVVRAGLQQPVMWITRDAETMQLEGWAQSDIDEHQTTMRTVFERLPGDGYFVRVRGMFHLDLTDAPSWSPLPRWLHLTGPIGVRRAHHIINAYSLAFFDRHLRGLAAPLLDGPSDQYPEVLFETRGP
jgi:predicted dienelactone hydrolase